MSLLSDKLQEVFKHLRGYGKLTEENVAGAVREVRLALLAADVEYGVARDFCDRVKGRALGEEVAGAVRPGDYFVKIVHDELLAFFGREDHALAAERPLRVALCGLNGAGKTTTAAKLAAWLQGQGERVRLVAADLSRPAAGEQLAVLGREIGVEVLLPQGGDTLESHLARVRAAAGSGVTLYDLAGRTDVDEALLEELERAVRIIDPRECLLVADAALGQAAGAVARQFQARAPLTGLVLSKFDGDARGGTALTLQSLTGCPVKFLGTGERVEALEPFVPERLVGRLLGQGDLIGLAERVTEQIDLEDAARLEERMRSRQFNLQDFLDQMRQMKKMGPLQNWLGMLPGLGNMPNPALEENRLKRAEAIVCSMTREERRRPEVLNARRRQRIAAGSGTAVAEVNDLLRRFRDMKKLMERAFRGGNPEQRLRRLLQGGGL
jgi:signal recognition particle subunit SRP54